MRSLVTWTHLRAQMHNAQGAYQGLTLMHTPMDIRHTAQQCAKLGLKRAIPLHILAPAASHPTAAHPFSSGRTNSGFHTGETAECRTVIISLLRTVVLLTSDKCNSNLGSRFSPMNKTCFSLRGSLWGPGRKLGRWRNVRGQGVGGLWGAISANSGKA